MAASTLKRPLSETGDERTKHIELIAIALCVLMVTTVGASVVAAKPAATSPKPAAASATPQAVSKVAKPTPSTTPQKGNSPVYQLDVMAAGRVVGKITINTANPNKPTFIFNGKGLAPSIKYYLYYTTSTGRHAVGSASATKAGTLSMHGAWLNPVGDLKAKPTFALSAQALGDSNYQFDVLHGSAVAGQISIDSTGTTPPFSVVASGLENGKQYWLYFKNASGEIKYVGNAESSPKGMLFMTGAWTNPTDDLSATPSPVFILLDAQQTTKLTLTIRYDELEPPSPVDGSYHSDAIMFFIANLTQRDPMTGEDVEIRNQSITVDNVPPDLGTKVMVFNPSGSFGIPPVQAWYYLKGWGWPEGSNTYHATFAGTEGYAAVQSSKLTINIRDHPLPFVPVLTIQNSETKSETYRHWTFNASQTHGGCAQEPPWSGGGFGEGYWFWLTLAVYNKSDHRFLYDQTLYSGYDPTLPMPPLWLDDWMYFAEGGSRAVVGEVTFTVKDECNNEFTATHPLEPRAVLNVAWSSPEYITYTATGSTGHIVRYVLEELGDNGEWWPLYDGAYPKLPPTNYRILDLYFNGNHDLQTRLKVWDDKGTESVTNTHICHFTNDGHYCYAK